MELFFELIQIAVGTKRQLSHVPSDEEWLTIFKTAQKQAVAGITFLALEKLGNVGVKPPLNQLYEWMGLSEQIKNRNTLLNKRCLELTELFSDAGYESCILKGQGNALMYPEPLLRTSGDIDIWVRGDRNNIIEFCQSKVKGCDVSYHHILFPIWDDVDVEAHFVPSYSIVPRYEKHTKDFYSEFKRQKIDGKGFLPEKAKMYVPSKVVNLVFQMSHIARHFFYGGVGLRQLMDYYYLLKSEGVWNKDDVIGTLRNLGLYKFAGAVMWVLKEVLAAEEKLLIIPVDEKRGKLLLSEIMKSGNFGHYDQRVSGKLMKKSATMSIIVRNMRMLRLFPEEALWAPVTGVWHYLKYKES